MGNEQKGKSKQMAPKMPSAMEIKTYIMVIQNKLTLYRNKKIASIKQKKFEIARALKENNLDVAKAKMDTIIREEDMITVYDILGPLCEILKERVTYIISNSECPPDLRAQLDSVIYASTRVEVQELQTLRDLIMRRYGQNYIMKADSNSDKLVNVNLVEKLRIKPASDVFVTIRLKQLCKEQKIPFEFPCEVENDMAIDPMAAQNPYGGSGEVNPFDMNQNNPYGPPQGNNNPYGPPQGNNNPYGPPQGNNNPYGPPQGNNNPYGPPQGNNNPYGPPQGNDNPYGPPQNDKSQMNNNPYGPPQNNNSNINNPYGPPQNDNSQMNNNPYGPPPGGNPFDNNNQPGPQSGNSYVPPQGSNPFDNNNQSMQQGGNPYGPPPGGNSFDQNNKPFDQPSNIDFSGMSQNNNNDDNLDCKYTSLRNKPPKKGESNIQPNTSEEKPKEDINNSISNPYSSDNKENDNKIQNENPFGGETNENPFGGETNNNNPYGGDSIPNNPNPFGGETNNNNDNPYLNNENKNNDATSGNQSDFSGHNPYKEENKNKELDNPFGNELEDKSKNLDNPFGNEMTDSIINPYASGDTNNSQQNPNPFNQPNTTGENKGSILNFKDNQNNNDNEGDCDFPKSE